MSASTADQHVSPRAFLMARRPERFSDSVVEETPALDRSLLEYHLETLTSRSQETEFARFAHRLAEREVCPNLLPQTGPTGGGDSKVDAETYPVADALAIAWFIGEAGPAASERWAFAFSAMKKWQPKVKSDVAKLVGTARGYTKAFFITNQYVPDKKRSQVEDALRKAYKLDVRILDRTWILDKVFTGRHEALAIEALGLTTDIRRHVQAGPRDTERERALTTVEARIVEAVRDGRLGHALVDDAREAAELARGLERPRTDVEGRFARAAQLASQYGTAHQQLRAAYEHAWTRYFWYEDMAGFLALYPAVEERALDSRNAYELELLTNLWLVLRGSVADGLLNAADAALEERRARLEKSLQHLASDGERRSSALQARVSLLLTRLATSTAATVPEVVRKLGAVVHEAEGLVGFPLEPLVEILTELGQHLAGDAVFDEVFDGVVAAVARREGALKGARLYLRRGLQQLDRDRPYEAIRALGRALPGLYTHESRREVVLALCACAHAYERVGLLWAARGTLLSAASVATNEFWSYQDVTVQQAIAYGRLKWVELQLGRLPHALAWHDVDRVLRSALRARGHDPERLAQDEFAFDASFGILLLRSDAWDLKLMIGLPDVLEQQLDLPMAAVALRYALGHEDSVPRELIDPPMLATSRAVTSEAAVPASGHAPTTGGVTSQATAEDEPSEQEAAEAEPTRAFFRKWRDQPVATRLPKVPSLGTGVTVTMSTAVLGCRVSVDATNRAPLVDLAESFLAAMEAMLATGSPIHLIAREPAIVVRVRPSDTADAPFSFERNLVDGRPEWEIRCRVFDPFHVPAATQQAIKERLWALVVDVLAHAFVPRRISDVEALFRDELAHQRALDFTGSFVTLGNVLGDTPRTSLAAWTDAGARTYPLRRDAPWDAEDRAAAASASIAPTPTLRSGEPPPDGMREDMLTAKHTEMATFSLIREPLWNEAKWMATAFVTPVDAGLPPVLALIFRDGRAGAQIARGWRRELGAEDTRDALRVSIIRGVSRANSFAYRVVVSTNPAALMPSGTDLKLAMFVGRVNTMEPTTGTNLERFLESVRREGVYDLTVGISNADQTDYALARSDTYLRKRVLHVRQAWEVGPHDLDAIGIRSGDDPVLPAHREPDQIPILALLQDLKARDTEEPAA